MQTVVELAVDVVQHSVERLEAFALAAFGVRLRLSVAGDEPPAGAGGSAQPGARRVGNAGRDDRLLLALPEPGDGGTDPPGMGPLLDNFLDMAADLLGALADSREPTLPETLREPLWRDLLGAPTIVGISAPVRTLRTALQAVANSGEPLFLAGEPGSGRREIAVSVHRAGTRAAGPFITEHLAALPEGLRETEVFGRGDGPGLLGAAAGGTLHLAGIEHLPGRAQERLLAHLRSDVATPLPARIITDADVEESALVELLRPDLLDRLRTLVLAVPALRERPEDIPLIAAHLLRRRAAALGESPPEISSDALDALKMRPWAGNVRELDEELARAAAGRAEIRRCDIRGVPPRTGGAKAVACGASLRQAVSELEVGLVSQALAETNWNKSRSARILGLSRLGLQKKIDRYGIDRRR